MTYKMNTRLLERKIAVNVIRMYMRIDDITNRNRSRCLYGNLQGLPLFGVTPGIDHSDTVLPYHKTQIGNFTPVTGIGQQVSARVNVDPLGYSLNR